jgi:hypothetical protein
VLLDELVQVVEDFALAFGQGLHVGSSIRAKERPKSRTGEA